MHNIQLVPECYAETEMVKILFNNADYLNHAEGIHSVRKILKQRDVINYRNIGFIDNDKKNVPRYFDEFEVLDQQNDVAFKKHPSGNDYLIVVRPAIERFILSQLNEIHRSPSDYDLPDDFNGFRKKLKSSRIGTHEGYKRLVFDLSNSNTTGISFIKAKVSQLVSSA